MSDTEIRTCPDCKGSGLLWSEALQEENVCKLCEGDGSVCIVVKPFGNEKLTREELNRE